MMRLYYRLLTRAAFSLFLTAHSFVGGLVPADRPVAKALQLPGPGLGELSKRQLVEWKRRLPQPGHGTG